MKPDNTFSHTWPAILWFNLPLALVLSWVFHNIVRKDMINNLPGFLYKRFYSYTAVDWNRYFARHYLVVTGSVLLGVCSHLIWDECTQGDGIVINQMVLLLSRVHITVSNFSLGMTLFYANSVAGVLGILYAIMKLPVTAAPARESWNIARYWVYATGIYFLFIACRLLTDLSFTQYWELLYTSITACLISLIITPMLMNAKEYKRFPGNVL